MTAVLMWLHTQKAKAKVENLCPWSGNTESKNRPQLHGAQWSYSRDTALKISTKSDIAIMYLLNLY